MRLIAENAKFHEQGGRVSANFIPFDEMTEAQKIDHLRIAHAFAEYEGEGEPQYFEGFAESALDVFHDEDHNSEHEMGGSTVCQHTHGKVNV